MIKAIVSDVDGTLIYKGARLNTARFPVMLSRLEQLNIPFAVATGRHYSELEKLFGTELSRFVAICCNGAYAVKEGNIVHSLPISSECAAHFFAQADRYAAAEFHSKDITYIFGGTPLFYSKEKSRLINIRSITSPEDIGDDIFCISVYGVTDKFTAPAELQTVYASKNICEYTNADASKYNAVLKFAESNMLNISDIMFFGDGENDRELLEKCGVTYSTYCADSKVFSLTANHTRDVIGTVIRLSDQWKNTINH